MQTSKLNEISLFMDWASGFVPQLLLSPWL